MEGLEKIDFQQLQYLMSKLSACSENCFYILDFKNDSYIISEKATQLFKLDQYEFGNAEQEFTKLMHPDDYPIVIENLNEIKQHKATSHDMEYRWLDKNDNWIWINCRGEAIYDESGQAQYLIGIVSEIGRHKRLDNVTSLYCENVLQDSYLKLSLSNISSVKGYLMFIGIDNFKEINDKYGYNVGDKILENMSQCIKLCITKGGMSVYRMDGDEFSIFVPDRYNDNYDSAKELYKQIRSRIDFSFEQRGYHMFHTISAGAAFFDTGTDSYDNVMRQSKYALHSAKINGKNIFVGYQEEEYLQYIRKLDIQECLRKSIEENYKGFELYYQPIMNIKSFQLRGAEALVRWNSEKYGFMSPVEFIPLLEESSLIIPLGKWIIETAVKQCKQWMKLNPDFVMNINLSFIQLQKSDVVKDALEYIDALVVPHDHIVFEVTESGAIESNAIMRKVLLDFTKKDFQLAIDDFGTGYANFRYIKEMTFGVIKIDKMFVQNIQHSRYDYLLVQYITELAHSLNLKVCYEGVETKAELDSAMLLNPDFIQGYYFGKPVDSGQFESRHIR